MAWNTFPDMNASNGAFEMVVSAAFWRCLFQLPGLVSNLIMRKNGQIENKIAVRLIQT